MINLNIFKSTFFQLKWTNQTLHVVWYWGITGHSNALSKPVSTARSGRRALYLLPSDLFSTYFVAQRPVEFVDQPAMQRMRRWIKFERTIGATICVQRQHRDHLCELFCHEPVLLLCLITKNNLDTYKVAPVRWRLEITIIFFSHLPMLQIFGANV